MNKICLIDADSMIFITIFSIISKPELNHDDFGIYKKAVDDWIEDTIKKTESTHYNLFLTIGKTFRHDIATNREYKSGRPAKKPKFYYELREHLIEKWQASYQDGVEAEDLVAVCKKYYIEEKIETIVAGIDHDLYQIPGKHYNYKKGEIMEITPKEAQYNLWKQIITGCTTDKIQGIPGIGDKKADKLLSDENGFFSNEVLVKAVLTCYTNHFGYCTGVKLFAETFKLVYLLRTQKEIEEVIGVHYDIPTPILYGVKEEVKSKDEF